MIITNKKHYKEGMYMERTVSLECRSCESDFLAITGTDEYIHQICYRCFMNGMAETYLEEKDIETYWKNRILEK